MPLIKTKNGCLAIEADAYVLIHDGSPKNKFMLRKVFRRAGAQLQEVLEDTEKISYGNPVITPGFDLKAKYVIHIFQPADRIKDPVTVMQYKKALQLAQDHNCESIVFSVPPYYEEAEKVYAVCRSFAQETEMHIHLSDFEEGNSGVSVSLIQRLKNHLGFATEKKASLDDWDAAYNLDDVASDSVEDSSLALAEELATIADFLEDEDCAVWINGKRIPEIEDAAASFAMPKSKPRTEFEAIQKYLKQNDAGFKDTLLEYIDRTGKKDSEIYKKANLDRRLFSKIMNVQGYNPSKPTAIAFAIALELNLDETKDLIGRAGYTLSQASTFDRIIEFFILEGNYDIYEINEALFYFDQSLLGC